MKNKFTINLGRIVAVFFIFQMVCTTVHAHQKSIFDKMQYQAVLQIKLKGDFTALLANRRSQDDHKMRLSFKDENKIEQNWKIKTQLRGNFRRIKCTMPPLRLDFKKKDLEMAGLAPFDDMKLVTHCSDNKEEAKAWLAREYLVYQLYAELTPDSYRTQMVRIIYIDTQTGEKTKNWGFLIEDTAQLAARMNAEKIDQWGLQAADFHPYHFKLMALFQYMVGNTDWKTKTCKNLKFFRREDKIIPVPYDFDFAAVVATTYATPDINYGLKSLQERAYLGFATDLHDMHAVRAVFAFKEKALIAIVETSKMVNNISKTYMTNYLNSFFDNMDNIQLKKMIVYREIATTGKK